MHVKTIMAANFEICDNDLMNLINDSEYLSADESQELEEFEQYDEIEKWLIQEENRVEFSQPQPKCAKINSENESESAKNNAKKVNEPDKPNFEDDILKLRQNASENTELEGNEEACEEEEVPDNSSKESQATMQEKMLSFIKNQRSENTKNKTQGDIKRFKEFVYKQGEKKALVDIPPITMDGYVGHFLMELKKKNGTPYEPGTMTGFHR